MADESRDTAPFTQVTRSSVPPIQPVATSVAAFVGTFRDGPFDQALQVTSMADFDRRLGGLEAGGDTSYAVRQFFLNGGREAWIVRVNQTTSGNLRLNAAALVGSRGAGTGIYSLDQAPLVSIICVPQAALLVPDETRQVYAAALRYGEQRRAMVMIDVAAGINRQSAMEAWLADNAALRHPNAVVYFPWTTVYDPLNGSQPRRLSPSGTIAGLYARVDAASGVWKAPAGTDASLRNVAGLARTLSERESGDLNQLGVNVLRTFPGTGVVSWGARTLAGGEASVSEFKYVPVRRTALFLEESIARGLAGAAFADNGEPLWSQIRLQVGAFMQGLFRQGAFQGTTPRDAYFVKCDAATTTQDDVANGVVNVLIGFAAVKAAEFVHIRIQHRLRREP